MGQVVVNVNGRSYRFDCGDGEEARLNEIAALLRARIESLAQQYGKAGGERLLVMAALLITDELMDARAALAQKGGSGAETSAQVNGQPAAQKREQEAIRSEHRRRAAAGDV